MALVRLLAFADNDITEDASVVNSAMINVPDVSAYMFIGDGPYSKSGTKWVELMDKSFGDKKDKLIFSRGNHDEDESESKQTQEDIEAWFPEAKGIGFEDTWLTSKVLGNVYVISMDTQDLDIEFERDQFNFVKAELEKAKTMRSEGKIDWIVILFHKPFFTLKSSHSPYTAVRFLYREIFRDAQVDFCISGHNHNTQLWYPMIPNDSQANGEGEQLFKYLDDNKTFDFSKDHGQLYIVTGHAGHEWNKINDSGTGTKNTMHYRSSGDFGFTQLDFDGKKAIVKSVGTSGEVFYEYVVSRDGGIIVEPPKECKKNWHWSEELQACIPDIQPPITDGPPPPPGCLPSECKDPTTKQCRKIAADEIVDEQGFCKKKDEPEPGDMEIDEHGIGWFSPEVKGKKTITVEQSRDEADDDRWSANAPGCEQGFEQTMIAKSINIAGDGHFASKLGGSNHSGGGASKQRWMDLGVRADGSIQLQWEGPHPKNHSFKLPAEKQFITDIGMELEGNWLGLKWIQNILKEGGSPADGGVRWRMYVNTDIAEDGKPDNSKWKLAFDFIDGVDIEVIQPQDYKMTGEMDVEVRRSGTQEHQVYAGGLLIRPFNA